MTNRARPKRRWTLEPLPVSKDVGKVTNNGEYLQDLNSEELLLKLVTTDGLRNAWWHRSVKAFVTKPGRGARPPWWLLATPAAHSGPSNPAS